MQTSLALMFQPMTKAQGPAQMADPIPDVAPDVAPDIAPDMAPDAESAAGPGIAVLGSELGGRGGQIDILVEGAGTSQMTLRFPFEDATWGNEAAACIDLEISGEGAEVTVEEVDIPYTNPHRLYLTLDSGTPPERLTTEEYHTSSGVVPAPMVGGCMLLPYLDMSVTRPPLATALPPGFLRLGLMMRRPRSGTVVLRLRAF